MTKVSQDKIVTVARILGAEKLLPCILLGMVLYFLFRAMTPMFVSTNETFREYIVITEKRLAVEEKIAENLERLCRRQRHETTDN